MIHFFNRFTLSSLIGSHLALVIAVLGVLILPLDGFMITSAQAADVDTLANISIVHGQVFDSQKKPIKLDATTLEQLQNATIEKVSPKTSKDIANNSLKTYNQMVRALPATATGEPHPDKLLANAVRIGMLGKNQKSTEWTQIARANSYLTSRVLSEQNQPLDLTKPASIRKLSPNIASTINEVHLRPDQIFLPPSLFYSYSKQCSLSGVPVPPSFNSNGSTGWHREGSLDFSILNPGQYSELYTYTPANGKGLCMALPIRKNSAQGNYDALGIICQGLSTKANTNVSNSRSCYWDNADASMVPNTTYSISGPTFIAPPNLPQNNQCSDCHAGENAFITHKGSVIETAKDNFNNNHPANNFTTRNNWHTPKVDVKWPQNPEPAGSYNGGNGLSTSACSSCHTPSYAGRLPDVTGAAGTNPARDKLMLYCYAIASGQITSGTGPHAALVGLNGLTGPMNSYAGGTDLDPVYQACSTVVPNFLGFPADATAWVNW